MNDNIFEELHYHSGLVAQGCWDELDEYDREAIKRFGNLIVKECIEQCQQQWYDENNVDTTNMSVRDIAIHVGKKSGYIQCINSIKEHFGVK